MGVAPGAGAWLWPVAVGSTDAVALLCQGIAVGMHSLAIKLTAGLKE